MERVSLLPLPHLGFHHRFLLSADLLSSSSTFVFSLNAYPSHKAIGSVKIPCNKLLADADKDLFLPVALSRPFHSGHVALPRGRLAPRARPRRSFQQSLRDRPRRPARLARSFHLFLLTRRAPFRASFQRHTDRPVALLPRVVVDELRTVARPSRALAALLAPLAPLARLPTLLTPFLASLPSSFLSTLPSPVLTTPSRSAILAKPARATLSQSAARTEFTLSSLAQSGVLAHAESTLPSLSQSTSLLRTALSSLPRPSAALPPAL